MATVKQVQYLSTNSYLSLNQLTDKTKYVWMVFHGMGYLSKYFIRYFDGLDKQLHYIIAPQAPSKYYLDQAYKNVGASWLTKVDTLQETKNVLDYVDAVYKAEYAPQCKLIIMGYSQGVSIACRWLANHRPDCHHLILHSGGIPKELTPDQFSFLAEDCPVDYVYGDQDPYITTQRLALEQTHASKLFSHRLKMNPFVGGHEVNSDFLTNSYVL